MDSGSLETTASVFGATGGVGTISALLAYRMAKRQASAEATAAEASAANMFTKTALALLEPVRQAAAESERRAVAFLKQISELEAIVASLTGSLTQATVQATTEREKVEKQLAQAQADCASETGRLRSLLAAREKELSALQDQGFSNDALA